MSRLSWVSRAGIESDVDSTLTRAFGALALSPTGDRIAVSIVESANNEAIWLDDLTRRTLARLTPSGERSFRPTWTPDGSRVLFVGDHGGVGQRRIFSLAPDGNESLRVVVSRTRLVQEISWSAAGSWFAFREGWSDGATRRDIYAMVPGRRCVGRARRTALVTVGARVIVAFGPAFVELRAAAASPDWTWG